jgi:hypothetical protein
MVWVQGLPICVHLLDEVNLGVFSLTLVILITFVISFALVHSLIFSKVLHIVHSVTVTISHPLDSLRDGMVGAGVNVNWFIVVLDYMSFIFYSVVCGCVLVALILTLALRLGSLILVSIDSLRWYYLLLDYLSQIQFHTHCHIVDGHHTLSSIIADVIIVVGSSWKRGNGIPDHPFSLFIRWRFLVLIKV